jgi:peptide/nickel transport system substrate-binding protein
LATSWERLDDFTMQFKLRENVTFHNGEPFNAEAVRYSLERFKQPETKSGLASFYSNILRADVIDDYTVNVVTEQPDPILLNKMSGFNTNIVPPKYCEEVGKEGFSANPVGTGPYKFVSWVRDGDLVLEANPDYWGPKPAIQRVRFKFASQAATRVAALKAGEVDLCIGVPPDEIESINASGRAKVETLASNRIIFYGFTCNVPPLDDPKVRQAISYGIDVDSIVKNILLDIPKRTYGLLAPWHFGYHPTLEPWPYDPDKCRELLAEAGYPDGLDLNINLYTGRFAKDIEIAQAMAGSLANAGVRATVVPYEVGAWGQKSNACEIDGLAFLGWGNWMMDAANTLDVQPTRKWGIEMCTPGSTWKNDEFDRLVEEAGVTLDEEKRLANYYAAQEIMYEEAPYLPLFQLAEAYGMSNRLQWTPRADEMVWAHRMSFQA